MTVARACRCFFFEGDSESKGRNDALRRRVEGSLMFTRRVEGSFVFAKSARVSFDDGSGFVLAPCIREEYDGKSGDNFVILSCDFELSFSSTVVGTTGLLGNGAVVFGSSSSSSSSGLGTPDGVVRMTLLVVVNAA